MLNIMSWGIRRAIEISKKPLSQILNNFLENSGMNKVKYNISDKNRTQTTNQWSIIYKLTQGTNQ